MNDDTSDKIDVTTVLLHLSVVILAAFAWGVYTLGVTAIDPSNTDWIRDDLAQVYLAWARFLGDSPDGLSLPSTSYPLDLNFALYDPMPIFLLAADALGIDGLTGQFFGLYFLLSLVLYAVLAYFAVTEIARAATPGASRLLTKDLRRSLVLISGTLIVLLIPFVVHRYLAHTALSSKWLLMWAILAALQHRESSHARWLVSNGLVLFVAGGVNPYLTVMVAGTGAIFLLFRAMSSRAYLSTAGVALAYLAVGYGSLVLFGFASGSSAATGGFGYYSMNLLGPFDSNGLAGIFPLDVPDATGGQAWEGFNYLGLGALVLIGLAFGLLILRPATLARLPIKEVALIALAFTALALSNVVSLGAWTLEVRLPQPLLDVLGKFRGSGRFFWIVGLWLAVLSIGVLITRLGVRRCAWILPCLLAIQILDVLPIGANIRTTLSGYKRVEIPELEALEVPQDINHLVLFPPWQCDHVFTPGGIRNFEPVGFFAHKNGLTTNSFYAARTPQAHSEYHCNVETWEPSIAEDGIYLLSDAAYDMLQDSFTGGFTCTDLSHDQGGKLCVPINPES